MHDKKRLKFILYVGKIQTQLSPGDYPETLDNSDCQS